MSTIAVTGASGFVGRHVLEQIQHANATVLATSRHPVQVQVGQWKHLDLSNPETGLLKEIAASHSLVHLAWGGLPNYMSDHHVTEQLGLQETLLQMVCEQGLRSLVVAGTCLEYGMQEGELSETSACSPHVPYAIAKDRLRRFTESLCKRYGVKLVWARLFYLHGEGQAPTSLWTQLQHCINQGERRFSMSGGQQVRDFLPISEAARILVRLARDQADAGILNVCSGEPLTVEQHVRGWIEAREADVCLELGRFPYPPYEPFRFWGCRKKLDQTLLENPANA